MKLVNYLEESELTNDSKWKMKIARYLLRSALISEASLEKGFGNDINTAVATIEVKIIFDGKKWRKP